MQANDEFLRLVLKTYGPGGHMHWVLVFLCYVCLHFRVMQKKW